jgi:O-antigen/teichoic acid export membrane protein
MSSVLCSRCHDSAVRVDMTFARQVAKGMGAITLSGVGTRLLAFLTVPLLTPLLGPEPYGTAALVGTVVSIGSTLSLVGIDMAYMRYFLGEAPAQRSTVERFCWRFATGGATLSGLVFAVAWSTWGVWLTGTQQSIAIYCGIAVVLSSTVTMATSRVRLHGQYSRVAVAMTAAAVASAAASIAIAMLWPAEVWALLGGVIAAALTNLVILGLPPLKTWTQSSSLSVEGRRQIIGLGLAGSVTAPIYWLISSADRWFINSWAGSAEVGVYAVASNIAMIGNMLVSSMILVWYPEVSRVYGERGSEALPSIGRLWARMVAGFALVWVVVSSAGGDILRLLAAPAFHIGSSFIPWLAGGVFFYGIAQLSVTSLFLEANMRYVAFSWAVGGAVNLVLNWVMVSRLGGQGAAAAQCLTFFCIASLVLLIAQRRMPLPIEWRRVSGICVFTLLTGLTMSPSWNASPLLSLLYKLPVGVLCSALFFQLAVPDWYQLVLHRLHVVKEGVL